MFQARHEKVTQRFALPLSAGEALELFTPEGERLWIADWRPRYLHPANGEALEGMVFATGESDELTYWTMLDFDLSRHRIRYCRLTPGSRSVIVEVVCIPRGGGECDVEVSYALTGLSDAGNAFIARFVGDAYATMMDDWRDRIVAHLKRSPHRVFGADI